MNYDSLASRSISASSIVKSIWSTVLSCGTVGRFFRFRSDCDDDGVLRGSAGGVNATCVRRCFVDGSSSDDSSSSLDNISLKRFMSRCSWSTFSITGCIADWIAFSIYRSQRHENRRATQRRPTYKHTADVEVDADDVAAVRGRFFRRVSM